MSFHIEYLNLFQGGDDEVPVPETESSADEGE